MKAKGLLGFLWSSEEGGEGAEMGGVCAGGGRAALSQPEHTWPLCELGLEPTWPPGNRPFFAAAKELESLSPRGWALTGPPSSPQSHLTDGGTEVSENPAHCPNSQSGREASNEHGSLLECRPLPRHGRSARGAASQASPSSAATSVVDGLGGSRVSI